MHPNSVYGLPAVGLMAHTIDNVLLEDKTTYRN